MYCEFYLDVFFAVNLLLDFQILCLTNLMLRGTANPLRAFFGSILGAAGMCLFVALTPNPYRKSRDVLWNHGSGHGSDRM